MKDVIKIRENKRIICEFMGMKKVDWFEEEVWLNFYGKKPKEVLSIHNYLKYAEGLILDTEIKFDRDWNWIMDVWGNLILGITDHSSTKSAWFGKMLHGFTLSDKEVCFMALVEGIKEHNSKKESLKKLKWVKPPKK